MNGYRARRIEEVLGERADLSADDFRALHMDFDCQPGRELVKLLADFNSSDPDVSLGLELLKVWDGQLMVDSVGGCLYEVLRYTLVRELLEPGLGAALTLRLMGEGFHPVLFGSHEFYGHDTVTLLRLLQEPTSWWITEAGGREKLLTNGLKKAMSWLRANLGPEVKAWTWGRLHQVNFNHPLGLQKPLDQVFDRGPFPIGGDTDTVCQTAMHPHEPYDNNAWAPSYRQIVDLGDLSQSVAMYPPGQSGQLGSPHYDDLITPWLRGEYHPMLWERDQVSAAAKAKLVLVPVDRN
jgi:penicillin amidase